MSVFYYRAVLAALLSCSSFHFCDSTQSLDPGTARIVGTDDERFLGHMFQGLTQSNVGLGPDSWVEDNVKVAILRAADVDAICETLNAAEQAGKSIFDAIDESVRAKYAGKVVIDILNEASESPAANNLTCDSPVAWNEGPTSRYWKFKVAFNKYFDRGFITLYPSRSWVGFYANVHGGHHWKDFEPYINVSSSKTFDAFYPDARGFELLKRTAMNPELPDPNLVLTLSSEQNPFALAYAKWTVQLLFRLGFPVAYLAVSLYALHSLRERRLRKIPTPLAVKIVLTVDMMTCFILAILLALDGNGISGYFSDSASLFYRSLFYGCHVACTACISQIWSLVRTGDADTTQKSKLIASIAFGFIMVDLLLNVMVSRFWIFGWIFLLAFPSILFIVEISSQLYFLYSAVALYYKIHRLSRELGSKEALSSTIAFQKRMASRVVCCSLCSFTVLFFFSRVLSIVDSPVLYIHGTAGFILSRAGLAATQVAICTYPKRQEGKTKTYPAERLGIKSSRKKKSSSAVTDVAEHKSLEILQVSGESLNGLDSN